MLWASEADISLLAPDATWVGATYRSTLTYGQMSDNPSDGLSIRQMMEISGDAGKRHETSLRSAVVNNNLVFES